MALGEAIFSLIMFGNAMMNVDRNASVPSVVEQTFDDINKYHPIKKALIVQSLVARTTCPTDSVRRGFPA